MEGVVILTAKKYNDIIAGAVLLVITFFYYSGTFIKSTFQLSQYGAEFLPRIYCVVMAITSIGLIIKGIYELKDYKSEDTRNFKDHINGIIKVGISILLVVIYIALLEHMGFIIMTTFYLVCQIFVLAPKEKRKPIKFVLVSILCSGILNYIFIRLFSVALPQGIFGL